MKIYSNRWLLLLCFITITAASCQRLIVETQSEETDKVYYPIKNGYYDLGVTQVYITDLSSYGYTVAENCLDFPVDLTIGYYSYDLKKMCYTSYRLAPYESIQLMEKYLGWKGDSFAGSDFFSIDFGVFGTLSRGPLLEDNQEWFTFFISHYSKAEEIYDITSEFIQGKEYLLAHKVWVHTFPIDERLLQYLLIEGESCEVNSREST